MERASVISEAMEVGSVLMVAECRGVASGKGDGQSGSCVVLAGNVDVVIHEMKFGESLLHI